MATVDDCWLHPDTRALLEELAVAGYLTVGLDEVGAAERRLSAWGESRGVTQVVPLAGGAQSVVSLVLLDGLRVVVKAPFRAATAAAERAGLRFFSGTGVMPHLSADEGDVFVLEFLDGAPVEESDADAVREALLALHPRPFVCVVDSAPLLGVPSWLDRRVELFDRVVLRLVRVAPEWESVAAAGQRFLDGLSAADMVDWTVLHGDVRGKNLIRTRTGVRVLDPWTLVGPRVWEVVQAACSVAVAGGDAERVLSVATEWGLAGDEIAQWLRVGAVHHAAGSIEPRPEEARGRLLALLSSP